MARLAPAERERLRACGDRGRLHVDGAPVDLVVDVARSLGRRTVGLLGRREVPGGLLLHPCSSVHSLGMLTDLEVAYLDRELQVLEVTRLPRWRMHLPRRRAVAVLETAVLGLTARGVRPGSVLHLEPVAAQASA
ncbi:DUF192 domain-containing protein [Angustibacter aerolatus]